jgi:glycosidase
MPVQAPTAATTIVALLGASEWPRAPEFNSSQAFRRSAEALKAYFLDPNGLGVQADNVLDLFDFDGSADEVDDRIRAFLEVRLGTLEQTGKPAQDVLVYFTGHGTFAGENSDYYLAIRRTRSNNLQVSALPLKALAFTLREYCRSLRRTIILDCCFSAAAFSAFLAAGPAHVAIRKSIDAFEVPTKGTGFPTRGTVLLCSSSQKAPSLILRDQSATMFSWALLDALARGDPRGRARLSVRDVADLAALALRSLPDAPRPEVHSPDQSEGDVGTVELFPNAAVVGADPLAALPSARASSASGHAVQAALDLAARYAGSRTTRIVAAAGELREVPYPFPSPEDWRDGLIYFVFVDRFNSTAGPPRHQPWDEPFRQFQGGTFEGIRAQLDYIHGLGVNVLWLSPVFKNCAYRATSYHGYDVQDFLAIEPRFSSSGDSEAELRRLVDHAHALGIHVIVDIPLNHTGDVFAYTDPYTNVEYPDMPGWRDTPYPVAWRDETGSARADWREPPPQLAPDAAVWPSELQRNDAYYRQGVSSGQPRPTGDFDRLKRLRTSEPWVQAILIRCYRYLIARYDFDGLHIGSLDAVDAEFARRLTRSIRELAHSLGKRNFLMFGDVSEYDAIAKLRETSRTSDGADTTADVGIDYLLMRVLPEVIAGRTSARALADVLERRAQIWGRTGSHLVTALDYHNQFQRVATLVSDSHTASDRQVVLALACLLTLPGIPMIYYGTEQGLGRGHRTAGIGSRSSSIVREALWGKPDAFDRNGLIYQKLHELAIIRSTTPSLRFGRVYIRATSTDGQRFEVAASTPSVLAYSRIHNEKEIVVVANTDTLRAWQGEVIVDIGLNVIGSRYEILYSNSNGAFTPPTLICKPPGDMCINGERTTGSVSVLRVHLGPGDMQIITSLPN